MSNTAESSKIQDRLSIENLEKNRFGILVFFLLLVGCLAGIAVGLGALTQVFSLIILAFTTMTALSMMLAVAPMKAIVYTSGVAIVADLIIILVNLF
jgi:pheromone shutdown protein TraB